MFRLQVADYPGLKKIGDLCLKGLTAWEKVTPVLEERVIEFSLSHRTDIEIQHSEKQKSICSTWHMLMSTVQL